ncbi:MAG: DUF2336 domain-containing protein [Rhodospirillales bacterium]|nr:DUF2336 domain-containing protein [Rhodospirillales bacterium]
MTDKSKKIASLSGSLLARSKGKSAAGFVLRPVESGPADLEAGAKAREDRAPAEDTRSLPGAPLGASPGEGHDLPAEDRDPTAGSEAAQAFLSALRQGERAEAEAVFGQITGLCGARVRRALYGPGGRNLAIACRALGLEQLQFVSIFILTRKLAPGRIALNPYKLTEIVNYFLDTDEETARRVLKQWQCESVEIFGEESGAG